MCGYNEAIMLDNNGYVAECTGDNIFYIKSGKLFTSPGYIGALKGITMKVIMRLAEQNGIPAFEDIFTRFEVYTADEVFLTGTAAEVVPVIKVDSRVIGEGTPGPLTLKLIKLFKDYANSSGTPIE